VNPRRSPLPTDVGSLSDLPPAFDERVAAGLAALRLDLDDTDRARLRDHVRLLLGWNEAINLTAIRDPVTAATAHILDSLSAAPLLRSERVTAFVDLGSGGGFPGIPLAIALPAEHAVLVESIGKKAGFLQTAVAALGLGGVVEVRSRRAEEIAARGDGRTWPAVVARAVAALPRLVELAMPLLDVGGLLVAWKRLPFEDELDAGRRALWALGGGEPEVHPVSIEGLDDHVLVVARKVRAASGSGSGRGRRR
jgi:16S rRNA (guanine527-N7)-methyltransferase